MSQELITVASSGQVSHELPALMSKLNGRNFAILDTGLRHDLLAWLGGSIFASVKVSQQKKPISALISLSLMTVNFSNQQTLSSKLVRTESFVFRTGCQRASLSGSSSGLAQSMPTTTLMGYIVE